MGLSRIVSMMTANKQLTIRALSGPISHVRKTCVKIVKIVVHKTNIYIIFVG